MVSSLKYFSSKYLLDLVNKSSLHNYVYMHCIVFFCVNKLLSYPKREMNVTFLNIRVEYLKLLTTRLYVQQLFRANTNQTIKVRAFCEGKSLVTIGFLHEWSMMAKVIPLTKDQ